jgi:hypothetical protein
MASAKQLVEIRSRRGPYSDPRRGRLLDTIVNAFTAYNADVLSSRVLLDWCFGAKPIRNLVGGTRTWHRANVKRAAPPRSDALVAKTPARVVR